MILVKQKQKSLAEFPKPKNHPQKNTHHKQLLMQKNIAPLDIVYINLT